MLKTAFVSAHSKAGLVQSTPKEHGGKTPGSEYFVRFHPEEKRWSCTCPDWQYRRKGLDGRSKKKHDCKHILAHKKDKKPWQVKSVKVPNRPVEKVAFWEGFFKQADVGAGDGGGGFTGTGKGQINSQPQQNEVAGTIDSGDTKVDHSMRDRERDARDYSPFKLGPEFTDEILHLRY
jgi:hypothetical protein